MKSFQAYRKAKIPTVAAIGIRSGEISFQNVCHVEAPSIRAASSNSRGIDAGGRKQHHQSHLEHGGKPYNAHRIIQAGAGQLAEYAEEQPPGTGWTSTAMR